MNDNTAMTPELIAFVREQKDRQEIHDCLMRYARGIDRFDKELMASAYHPDGFDQHGIAEGVAADFCDWAVNMHGAIQTSHQHIINNHSVEIDGDVAHAETYFMFWGDNVEGPPMLAFGRYIDRFEKRDGVWAIAYRVCITEKSGHFIPSNFSPEVVARSNSTGPSTRDKRDLSYARPLVPEAVVPRSAG